MSDSDKVKKSITEQAQRLTKTTVQKKDMLSTGSTLLNIACTGCIEGGFWKGAYFFMVGDSQSGKTFLARTCLAEATINKHFDDYRLIDDDVEGGALMNTAKYFGQALADRIEPPSTDDEGNPVYSETIEDFYYHLDDALENDRPCIYLLDSMDALGSKYEQSKFDENKKASRKGGDAKGSYGDGKAKINSSGIRTMLPKLRDTGSILIIINQTRDNIGAMPFQPQKTRSGGHALTFYAMMELWASVKGSIGKTVKGKKRKVGITSQVKVKKNRSTGRDRTIEFPIYYSHGIDDVGGCVDYLIKEGHWKGGTKVNAKDFSFAGRKEALIEHIENNELEFDLKQLVLETWNEIEKECVVKRKRKF